MVSVSPSRGLPASMRRVDAELVREHPSQVEVGRDGRGLVTLSRVSADQQQVGSFAQRLVGHRLRCRRDCLAGTP